MLFILIFNTLNVHLKSGFRPILSVRLRITFLGFGVH